MAAEPVTGAQHLSAKNKLEGSESPYMNTVGDEHTDQEAKSPGVFTRYFQVFFSPDLLFQELRTRPDYVGALLLGGALSAAGLVVIPSDLALATFREALQAQGQAVPPELENFGTVIRFAGPVAAFVLWPLGMAFFAGLVMLFFAILLGHEGTYRQYLAVVAHAQLIVATAAILLAPLRIFTEDAQLLLSVGTFATFLEPGYLLRFLSLLNLFGLWAWVLVALGAARIGRKRSWVGGLIFVLMIPVTTAAVVALLSG